MKQITILFLLVIQFSCAQTVVDMAGDSKNEYYRNGQYYIKDINGYLNDFEGTWKYEYDGNKEFRIILEKVEMYHVNETWGSNTFDYYTDGMYIRYEKHENGNLFYSSPSDSGLPSGISLEYGKAHISFTDFHRENANFRAQLTLNQEIQQGGGTAETKLHFLLDKFEALNPYHEEHPNEPFFSVPNDIEMTKVD